MLSEVGSYVSVWEFNRNKTLNTLAEVEKLADPVHVLGWRPGDGRAHIAWQLMHIAITEEIFATTRLLGTQPSIPDLVPRFKGGSTPDDVSMSPVLIRETLLKSRENLLQSLSKYSDSDLSNVLPGFAERGWSLRTFLQVVSWHEAHHQGQSHLTLNLYKATREQV